MLIISIEIMKIVDERETRTARKKKKKKKKKSRKEQGWTEAIVKDSELNDFFGHLS